MKFNEAKFKKIIKPYLMKCRSGDWDHAKLAVDWIKKIGKKRRDLMFLIMAGYIHDIGWYKVLPKKKLTLNQVREYEKVANSNSSVMTRKILKSFGCSLKQIKIINRLIVAADKHLSRRADEAVIVDADNLSKLNIKHLKGKYKQSDWLNLIGLWYREFPKRIKTKFGKKIYPKLLDKLDKYVK